MWGGPGWWGGWVPLSISEPGTHLPSDVACVAIQATVGLTMISWGEVHCQARVNWGGGGRESCRKGALCHSLSPAPGGEGCALGKAIILPCWSRRSLLICFYVAIKVIMSVR